MTVPNAHDKVVQIVRMKGPIIPSQINKELDTNIIFASAILSELVDKKVLKISNLKVGGTPLYYYPGQEYKLQNYSDKLHPKEREAYELLRRNTVLDDSRQQPVVRAALREIKDFARPLQVTLNGANHVFWKWYLLSNEDAEKKIKDIMKISEPAKKQEPEIQRKIEPRPEPKQEQRHEQRIEKFVRPEIKQEIKPRVEQRIEQRHEPRPLPRQELSAQPRHEMKQEQRHEIRQELRKEQARRESEPRREVQKELKKEIAEAAEEPKDKFFRKARKYFDESRITLIDYKIIRKETEIDFTVRIPSTVGVLTYFCKAKNKKKINDGDVSSLFVQSQSKKMPVLFLTTGELTKKAKDLLEKEFRNISVQQI